MERYRHDIPGHIRFDVRRATHPRAQRHLRISDQNLYLEICDFFLRPGTSHFAGVCDLLDDAVKTPVGVGVDFHSRFIPNFHVHNIVFVYIDNRLHSGQIRHPHDLGPGELISRNYALTEFAI